MVPMLDGDFDVGVGVVGVVVCSDVLWVNDIVVVR